MAQAHAVYNVGRELISPQNHLPRLPVRTVSVVIPTHNNGTLLREAVGSVLGQNGNFNLLEVIVVDDGSTDAASIEIHDELAGLPRVRLLRNSRNRGPAGARNSGAFAARGDWLAFLDADDIWLPASLETRVSAADRFPGTTLVSADFQIWDPDTDYREDNFFATRKRPARLLAQAHETGQPIRLRRPYREAFETVFFSSCSVLVERHAFLTVGGYEESLRYKEDEHLWIKLCRLNDVVFVPRSVFLYRQHASSMTARVAPPFEYDRALLDVILRDDLLPDLGSDIERRYVRGYVDNARWFRAQGAFGDAAGEAASGLRRSPFSLMLWQQWLAAHIHLR